MAGVMSVPLSSLHRHSQTPLRSSCPLVHRQARSSSIQVSCKAHKSEDSDAPPTAKQAFAVPLAAALAASMLLGGAFFPEDALAARSGGRVGGSAFRSAPAPRAAPAPRGGGGGGYSPGPSRSYNYYNYSSPPLVGGYGGGFGGINVFPSFGVPLFAGSGFFNLVLIAVVFSTVTGVVRSLLGGGKRRDDDFD